MTRTKIGFKAHLLICQHCNIEFFGKKGQKYCSRKHLWAAHRKRKYLATRENRVCLNCKKEFITKHLNQKHCSSFCQIERRRIIYTKTCPVCNLKFETCSNRKIYCTKVCNYKRKDKNRKRRGTRKTTNSMICSRVGKCEICSYSLREALEAHHYKPKEKIVLCGSCHNIWHKLSENKYSTKEFLINIVNNRLKQSQYPLLV